MFFGIPIFFAIPSVRLALGAAAVAALAACSGGEDAREVRFRSHDYAYSGLDGFTATAGEKVEFVMANDGPADHEFEVFGPDGKAIDEIEPLHAGKSDRLTLTLRRPGTYTYVCGVSDHEERGMKGTFVVR